VECVSEVRRQVIANETRQVSPEGREELYRYFDGMEEKGILKFVLCH